jgi:hypothetical protein
MLNKTDLPFGFFLGGNHLLKLHMKLLQQQQKLVKPNAHNAVIQM